MAPGPEGRTGFRHRLLPGRHPPERHSQCLEWFGGYLESYLRGVRRMLLMQRERIGSEADVSVDGTRELPSMTQRALSEVLKRFP